MNILGNQIILRALELEDCEMLMNMINDPETEHMLGGWSFPVSKNAQLLWMENLKNEKNVLRCIIEDANEKKAVGVVMLTDIDWKNGNAEIHIKLSPNGSRGKGYGTDSICTLVKYSFDELRLHTIYANVNSYNHASRRLFKKCGFEQEGVLRHRIYKKGKYEDVISFSRVNENFEE